MGPNEQNQLFAELSQAVCLYTYLNNLVLLRDMPSLCGEHKHFVTKNKKEKTVSPVGGGGGGTKVQRRAHTLVIKI